MYTYIDTGQKTCILYNILYRTYTCRGEKKGRYIFREKKKTGPYLVLWRWGLFFRVFHHLFLAHHTLHRSGYPVSRLTNGTCGVCRTDRNENPARVPRKNQKGTKKFTGSGTLRAQCTTEGCVGYGVRPLLLSLRA